MFVITLTRDWCDAMAMAKAKRLDGNLRMAAFYLDSAGRIRRSIAREIATQQRIAFSLNPANC